MVGNKKVKVLENYMLVEHGDYQAGFKTMEQCLKYVTDKDLKEFTIFNVAEVRIKVIVREEPIDYGE